MQVRVLGAHSLESSSTKMVSLLVDGVIALDAGGLTSSLSFPEQMQLKAILLTHRHYDHIRDVPAIGLSLFAQGSLDIYAPESVIHEMKTRILDGVLYPRFDETPSPQKPTFRYHAVKPGHTFTVEGYKMLALPMNHAAPAVSYQVTSPQGKSLFFTGDTGPGLAEAWKQVRPDLLLVECTLTNDLAKRAAETGHFTPDLLKSELQEFKKLKGYLPGIVVMHITPYLEDTLAKELALAAKELSTEILMAREGMLIDL